MEMTLWESSDLSVWASLTVCQVEAPSVRRAITALRSAVYQAAY